MMHDGKKRQCVIVFVKSPQPGRVKTRLSKVLGKETVLGLYKSFTADVIASLNIGRHKIRVFYHPPEEKQKLIEWFGSGFPLFPQRGADLGERMAHAFEKSFSDDFEQVLLVGTDLPDLPGSIFDEAFEALKTTPSVIGPTFDGGYYLIGFNRETFFSDIFEGLRWGTNRVFKRTMNVFASKGLRVHVLPKWRDIDRYEDLQYFMETNTKGKSVAVNTMKYISANVVVIKKAEERRRKWNSGT